LFYYSCLHKDVFFYYFGKNITPSTLLKDLKEYIIIWYYDDGQIMEQIPKLQTSVSIDLVSKVISGSQSM